MDPRLILIRAWEYQVKRIRLLPLLVGGVSLLLTLLSVIAVERSDKVARQLRIQVEADQVAALLQQNMATEIAILRSGRALFGALKIVDLPTFRRFVGELRDSGGKSGVRGIGWSTAVKSGDVAALERSMRAMGVNGFRVRPRLPAHFVSEQSIIYLEPMDDKNRAALGFDMLSEPKRRAAMRLAARTGNPAATAPVTLIQDLNHGNLPGFLLYIPVYGGDPDLLTPDQRETALKGYVYSAVRVSDFVNAIQFPNARLRSSIRLIDDTDSPGQMIYGTANADGGSLTASHGITVANRHWRLELAAARGSYQSRLGLVILASGIALSLLLAALTWLILLGGRNANTALLARQEFESVRHVLTRELTHRVKNTLATVTSLAMLTKRGATSVDGYVDQFAARLRALSATHDLLTEREWLDAPLLSVLEAEFAPYCNSSDVRLQLSGPDVMLSPNIAMSFGLAIHELVTNAAKYGALSVPNGTVSVEWQMASDATSVDVAWQESDGPAVVTPTYRGFGSDLVEKLMARELKSDVKIQFEPKGVRCALKVPIQTVQKFDGTKHLGADVSEG